MGTVYWDVNQLSREIHRTPAAIRNLCLRRKIPFRKPAGRLVFVVEEIRQWVDRAAGLRLEDLDEE